MRCVLVRKCFLCLGVAALYLWPCLPGLAVLVFEDWNDGVAQEHNWFYYEANPGGTPGTPVQWQPTGGIGDSGYIESPLSNLLLAPAVSTSTYFAAYTIPSDWTIISSGHRDVSQDLDFNEVEYIELTLNDLSSGLDLGGGAIHFYIAEVVAGNNQSFYYHTDPVIINSGSWNQPSTITLDSLGDWVDFRASGSTMTIAEVYSTNPEYGLVVVNSSGPSGILGIDNFAAVPEPLTGGLMMAGGAGLLLLSRKRRSPA